MDSYLKFSLSHVDMCQNLFFLSFYFIFSLSLSLSFSFCCFFFPLLSLYIYPWPIRRLSLALSISFPRATCDHQHLSTSFSPIYGQPLSEDFPATWSDIHRSLWKRTIGWTLCHYSRHQPVITHWENCCTLGFSQCRNFQLWPPFSTFLVSFFSTL